MTGRRWATDTSVAVPLLVATHPDRDGVDAAVGDRRLALAGHALVETYSILTRLPGDMRATADVAAQLIEDGFDEPIVLSPATARAAHRTFADQGIVGGQVYDGLVGLAAREHGATLLTRDARALPTYDALRVTVEVLP